MFLNTIQNYFFRNFNIIPDKDSGYSYIWSNLNNYDASQYYPTVGTKLLFMAIDLDQTENGTKTGYKLILDANHFGLSHALRFSISHAKHLMTFVQVNQSLYFFQYSLRFICLK